MAVNQELSLVYAVPREVEDPKAEAQELAVILQLDEGELEEKLDQPDGWYAVIAHKVEDDKADEIKSKKFKGIYFSPESERFYPAGNFASQVVGFVGSDGEKTVGRYGLEVLLEQGTGRHAGKLGTGKGYGRPLDFNRRQENSRRLKMALISI